MDKLEYLQLQFEINRAQFSALVEEQAILLRERSSTRARELSISDMRIAVLAVETEKLNIAGAILRKHIEAFGAKPTFKV